MAGYRRRLRFHLHFTHVDIHDGASLGDDRQRPQYGPTFRAVPCSFYHHPWSRTWALSRLVVGRLKTSIISQTSLLILRRVCIQLTSGQLLEVEHLQMTSLYDHTGITCLEQFRSLKGKIYVLHLAMGTVTSLGTTHHSKSGVRYSCIRTLLSYSQIEPARYTIRITIRYSTYT